MVICQVVEDVLNKTGMIDVLNSTAAAHSCTNKERRTPHIQQQLRIWRRCGVAHSSQHFCAGQSWGNMHTAVMLLLALYICTCAHPFTAGPLLPPPCPPAGLSPTDIDILITNCSIYCPTPSIASMVINQFKMREDIEAW